MRRILLLSVLLTVGLVAVGQRQPPGQIRPRPTEVRDPDLPPPTIREYKPRSTLIVPEHPVPRAKFPVVDLHGHPPALVSDDVINRVVEAMDPLNLRVMVNASGASGARLRRQLDAIRASRHKDRFVMFTNVVFRNVGPGFGRKAAQQLEADVKAGASGLGEIMKGFGLRVRKTDNTLLKLDDPELDPICETSARLSIPVFIHTADPAEFFQPLDYNNERWLEMALFPGRRYFDDSRFPPFEELMAERDHLVMKHPKTTFVPRTSGLARQRPRAPRHDDG